MGKRLRLRAEDIMSRDVPILARDASVAEAVRFLAGRGVSCAVVLGEGGEPEGIVTESDLLALAKDDGRAGLARMLQRMLEEEHHLFDSMRELRKAAATRVDQVMSSPVQCAEADMTLGEMARVMETYDDRQLPVVREGRVVGLVTRHDIVRALAGKS